jgi:hypothetical protein
MGSMKEKFIPSTEKKLGQILVERNIISPLRLQAALDRQKKQNGKCKYLGEILLEMGIPQGKINEALDAHGKRKPLGEILVELRILTPDQLRKALDKQGQLAKMGIRRPLGKLLVEMGYTRYETLREAFSKHFNMPMISLRTFSPSSSLQRAVGEAYALRHKIVVLENDSAKARFALAEPNPFIMDELRKTFPPGKRVEFYLASPGEIDFCLKQKFDPFALSHYR